jgi:hypothetical protein
VRQLSSMNETKKKKSTLNRSLAAAILRVVRYYSFQFFFISLVFFFVAFVFHFLFVCFEIEPTMAHCGNTAPCPALCCKKEKLGL